MELREPLEKLGFSLKLMLNMGPKIQNLFIHLLKEIGFQRLSIIAKNAFEIIKISRPEHIPILGNESDPNLAINPKSTRVFKITHTEFTLRNPTYLPLAIFQDLRQLVVNTLAFKIENKTDFKIDRYAKIDEDFAIHTLNHIRNITGIKIEVNQYYKIFQKIKQRMTNLKKTQ